MVEIFRFQGIALRQNQESEIGMDHNLSLIYLAHQSVSI